MARATAPETAPEPGKAEGSLERYTAKRNFARTAEPRGEPAAPGPALGFVVQKHWASRLHYDFRLELDGVLLSWAVPKGPSFDPGEKRIAVHVEDHPVSYGSFEGTIPPKQYGAGTVIVWDRGTWEPVGDAHAGMAQGKLVFRLHGEKLAGLWELVRIAKPGDRQDTWILFKKRDEWARPLAEYDVLFALPDSVIAKPLGRVEEREARAAAAASKASDAGLRNPAALHAGGNPLASAELPGTGRQLAPADLPGEGRGKLTPAGLPGAVNAPLPAHLEPQLATLAKAVPADGDWVHEIKFDGYRIMARIERGKARLITRGGHDWTAKMKPLAADIESLGLKSAWLDGEIVVLDAKGVPDFNALQNAFDSARAQGISYFLFDLPYLEGHDLRRAPLYARRALLRQLLDDAHAEQLRFSEDFPGATQDVLASACGLGLEGIIAKRRDAPYVSDRTETWLKIKCSLRQEFVIVGFTDRAGSRGEVGGLLLGYHEDGKLRFGGAVGTGWDAATGADLHKRLSRIETDRPAVDPDAVKPGRWSRRAPGSERWVEPRLVAEVSFSDWTAEGHIRHAKYHGLRDDKPPGEITRERAAEPPPAPAPPAPAPPASPTTGGAARGARIGSVKVSNAERVIDPSTGLTKLDLVRYYESVAEWMLPHLAGRPVSMVRAPTGIAGEKFFQKHDEAGSITGLRVLDRKLWRAHPPLLEVPDAAALVNAAQMNTVEFHTWNSTAAAIDQPDRMVFDLDPGEGVSWQRMQEAALLTRTLLDELGLASWLKTSGGKGLHVVVPLAPRLDYEAVKGFSQAVVLHLARTIPSRFVAKSGASNREGKVFVDYLRNGHGQTTAAAFSARARPGLGVSMPVAWEQLQGLKSAAQWTIATAREHLSFQRADPWAEYWRCEQTLDEAMALLDHKPRRRKPRSE